MQFITAHADTAISDLSTRLTTLLKQHATVLWLVPGGSNIPLSVQVMDSLPDDLTAKLTIMLTDERFGPVGHADSNYQQLLNAGFQVKQAQWVPTLFEDMLLEDLTLHFGQAALEQFTHNDVVLGQFGIGADGHIAGILPDSIAAHSSDPAASYVTADFVRITLTFDMLRHIHYAYAIVYGKAKHAALERLRDENLDPIVQPAQILKAIPDSYVYNDLHQRE